MVVVILDVLAYTRIEQREKELSSYLFDYIFLDYFERHY